MQHTFFTGVEKVRVSPNPNPNPKSNPTAQRIGIDKAIYSNVTVGAFAAHIYQFHKSEGVSQIRKKCEKLWHEIATNTGKKMSGGRMEGFLSKKGENFFDVWKNRYFILDVENGNLRWYKKAPVEEDGGECVAPQGMLRFEDVRPPGVTIEGECYLSIHTETRIYRLYHVDPGEALA